MSAPATPDIGKLMDQRNATEQARKEGKEAPAKSVEPSSPAETAAPAEAADAPPSRRSLQRKLNQHIATESELRGELRAIKEMMANGGKLAKPEETATDPEPQRKDFATDAEYQRAAGRWDARQEAKKVVNEGSEQTALREEMQTSRNQFIADRELFRDFDSVMEEFQEEHAKDFNMDLTQYPMLARVLTTSPVSAGLMYHLFSNPDDLRKAINLEPKPGKDADYTKQAAFLSRLEGRIEIDIEKRRKDALDKSGKQAENSDNGSRKPESKDENRSHPAEANAGRNAEERVAAPKPRPTREVSAPGGAPPDLAPKPGSPEWFADRNKRQFGR